MCRRQPGLMSRSIDDALEMTMVYVLLPQYSGGCVPSLTWTDSNFVSSFVKQLTLSKCTSQRLGTQ